MSWIFQFPAEEDGGNEFSSSTSSRTSSIGKNSDFWFSDSSDSEDFKEENEVQSAYRGKCDSTCALEEALPIRRGISEFYTGRSKTFVCLAEASSFSSIKEIGKTEDAYTRRRRNVLAHHLWNKNTSFPRLSNGHGISKRPISSTKSALALGITNALSRSESIGSTNSDSSSNCSQSPDLPEPLQLRSTASHNDLVSLLFPGQNVTPRRSFSLPELRLVLTGKTTRFSSRFAHDKK